jgi:hypothetical protein
MTQKDENTCRYCLDVEGEGEPLFRPCKCKGSVGYIHKTCLRKHCEQKLAPNCELCKHPFGLILTAKRYDKWLLLLGFIFLIIETTIIDFMIGWLILDLPPVDGLYYRVFRYWVIGFSAGNLATMLYPEADHFLLMGVIITCFIAFVLHFCWYFPILQAMLFFVNLVGIYRRFQKIKCEVERAMIKTILKTGMDFTPYNE